MDPAPSSPTPSEPPEPPATAVLVVQNGRLSGTRRALSSPLTLIGQGPECEVRLNVDEVGPLHCALVHGPAGVHLRDLGGPGGTLVNDAPTTTCSLQHGDEITVGPFRFRLEITDASLPDPLSLQGERDALRIQAAAVAAQQAALTEEEFRLEQRQTLLQAQEEQLAAHLEERRQRLQEVQEQARQERASLRTERDVFRQEQEQARGKLARDREAVEQAGRQARAERQRLVELRKRLRQRWRRHWDAQEADLQRREQELAAGQERLQAERDRLNQAQLRSNGETELERCRLREEWQELGLAQQHWEECLNAEHAERDRRLRELETRAAALTAGEQALAGERSRWEEVQDGLRREAEGLEVRIRNQRARLAEQAPTHSEAILPCAEPILPAPPGPTWPEVVRRLAGDLADQRWHLLEQWQRLVRVQVHWQEERARLLGDLETQGRQLGERERQIVAREQALDLRSAELQRRQEELSRQRCTLEGWHARLTLRETAWQGERAHLLEEVRVRAELADARLVRLEEMRRRRVLRWRRDVEEVRAVRDQCETLRRQYRALWQECQETQATLTQEQRTLAGQRLALERLRQEYLSRSPNAVTAERRLEKLRRRFAGELESLARDLDRDRQAIRAEGQRLEERALLLRQAEEEIADRVQECTHGQTEWEARRLAAEEDEQRRQQELAHLHARHEQDERQLAATREELERLARLLLEEVEPRTSSAQQAA